jgi:hypothetical protein
MKTTAHEMWKNFEWEKNYLKPFVKKNNKVRFCCPIKEKPNCDSKGYKWTTWLDRDNPSGTGDWETLNHFDPKKVKNNIC